MSIAYKVLESGKLPEFLLRFIIRLVSYERLWSERSSTPELEHLKVMAFRDKLIASPIALVPEAANQQHYEVPADFFQYALGVHRKYSSGYWPTGVNSLDGAEQAMLQLTCDRAELKDGQRILELGCGWGSLTLWMAKQFPKATIVAVSNSNSQREYIQKAAKERDLGNVQIITSDINNFSIQEKFDRVVSVEMFEHLRNWKTLFARIRSWLSDDGKLFFHIFTHKKYAYEFETFGTTNWLGKYFFTGGVMPSDSLPLYFADSFAIEQHWRMSGSHYGRTADAWHAKLVSNRTQVLEIFRNTYPDEKPEVWFERWRIFFLACAEMFGLRSGKEWCVSHYRFAAR